MSLFEKLFSPKKQNERKKTVYDMSYPEDRELLISILKKGTGSDEREKAVEKLPYPEERDLLRRLAINDADEDVRYTAVLKCRYPEDKDLLEAVAVDVLCPAKARYAAINELPYADCREILEKCARNDDDPSNRAAAIRKLSYPESREVICYAAENDFSSYVQAEAVKMLPYPEEADLLMKIANREVSPVFTKSDSKVPEAAQGVLIKAGVCPRCGAKAIELETTITSRDDDPDFEYETQAYRCTECNWHER